MALATWLRVLDALGGLAEVSRRLRPPREPAESEEQRLSLGNAALGQLETGLARVLVAALQEAFDRDRARMDLERSHLDAERQRAEEALRLELLRQIGERELGQIRLAAIISVGIWIASALLMIWLPGTAEPAARALLASGWSALVGALACAFVGHTHVTRWLAASRAESSSSSELPHHAVVTMLPWLLVAGLALTAASLIVSL